MPKHEIGQAFCWGVPVGFGWQSDINGLSCSLRIQDKRKEGCKLKEKGPIHTGRRGRKRKIFPVIAVIMAFVLAAGLIPGSAATGYTTDNSEKISDAPTDNSYINFLGSNNSTRYSGRVWTDKTVYTEKAVYTGTVNEQKVEYIIENDSDFLVSYSALATSHTVIGQQPTDTVFILDFSTSMTWGYTQSGQSVAQEASRIQALVDSVNEAIDTLIQTNSQNRIAITAFNGASKVILSELTSGEEMLGKVKDGKYLEITDYGYSSSEKETVATVECHINGATAKTAGGTNIQAGLFSGMSILANNKDTTYTINETETVRIPNIVLMSDGAPTTFSSAKDAQYTDDGGTQQSGSITNDTELDASEQVHSGSWWSSSSGVAIGSGNNNDPDSADGFTALLTAAYFKNAITRNYYGTDTDQEVNIYTIGFGTDVQDADMVAMANLVLNPEEHLGKKSGHDQVDAVSDAWETYKTGITATVQAPIGNGNNKTLVDYIVSHPSGDAKDNDPSSLAYANRYFSASDDQELESVFSQIISLITDQASVPTEVTGNPVSSGYITYTDPIGTYMEVKDVKELLWAGIEFKNPTKKEETSGNITTHTYTFTGEINSPVYGKQNVSNILIKVTEDANDLQTITIQIPAAAIPLRVNTITLNGDGSVKSNENNQAYPVRILYTVGLKEGVRKDDGTVNVEKVSSEYIQNHTNDNEMVSFYSNLYSGNLEDGWENSTKDDITIGDAYVEYTPSEDNPFYYMQEDVKLYTSAGMDAPADSFDKEGTYYFQIQYYEGTRIETVWIERSGVEIDERFVDVRAGDGVYLEKEAPRLGHLNDFIANKNSNETGTADSGYYPSYQGSGLFRSYLGNNGQLFLDQKVVPPTVSISGADLTVKKEISGRDWLKTDSFEVVLAAKDQAPLPAVTKVVLTQDAPIQSFGEITYEKAGTYIYELYEILGSKEGMEYENGRYVVTVTVEESGQNQLSVTSISYQFSEDETVSYDYDKRGAMVFTNEYDAQGILGGKGAVSIQAVKELSGRDQIAGEFSFQVTDKNGTRVAGGTNAADGSVTFDPITYTTSSLQQAVTDQTASYAKTDGKDTYTYQYTVSENSEHLAENGITQVTSSFQITVVVTDHQDGTLGIEVIYPNGETGLTFRNAYGTSAETTVQISGTKDYVLESGNNAPDIAGKYTFQLTGSEGAPLPEMTTVNNDAAGNVIFGDIKYTMENVFGDNYEAEALNEAKAIRTRTFTYTVTESGSVPGVTNDAQDSKSFEVTVTDHGDGTLSASAQPQEGWFSFSNRYSVAETDFTSPTDEAIKITKELTGRQQQEEEFLFVMVDESGNTVSQGTNGADGTVVLSGITFSIPGTYHFRIKETAGSLGGITYDQTIYWAEAKVTDNGNGSLLVSWRAMNDKGEPIREIVFHNVYRAEGTAEAMICASKVLEGRELSSQEFTFLLRDSGGNVVSQAMNDENGIIQFASLTFDAPGIYQYTIAEKQENAVDIKYDDTVYKVKVVVEDSQKGYFIATVDYNGQEPVFTNTYEKQESEEEVTNDSSGSHSGASEVKTETDKAADSGGEAAKQAKAVRTGDMVSTLPFILMAAAAFIALMLSVILKDRHYR